MMLFCSDLDNTLIFSYRQEIGRDKVCVEVMAEKKLSYMTQNSYRMLPQIRQAVKFVPVTTRTAEQYNRIQFGGEAPEYALVCNGGILLVRGVRDDAWYQESLSLAAEASAQMKLAKVILEQDLDRCFEVRDIEQLLLFTKSNEPEKTVANLKQNLSDSAVDVFYIKMKVYVIPKNLNKGMAIRRIKKLLKSEVVLAAGDSEMDAPMLKAADKAMLPQSLADHIIVQDHMIVHEGQQVFSDGVLHWVWKEVGRSCSSMR